MRNSMKALAVASVLATGLAAGPAVSAHEPDGSGGSMMGQGDMMGMMGMMGQMSEMMEDCNNMMQSMMGGHGSGKPDEQGRKDAPEAD